MTDCKELQQQKIGQIEEIKNIDKANDLIKEGWIIVNVYTVNDEIVMLLGQLK